MDYEVQLLLELPLPLWQLWLWLWLIPCLAIHMGGNCARKGHQAGSRPLSSNRLKSMLRIVIALTRVLRKLNI